MPGYGAEAAGLPGILFSAWRGAHYVTLAELLGRLGSFGSGLRWRVACGEEWDLTVELERRSAGDGMDTLTLLSLTTPGVQLTDAVAYGFAGGVPVVVLAESDSTFWQVQAADERVLGELRCHYPDATPVRDPDH